jgi:hypothetical protein
VGGAARPPGGPSFFFLPDQPLGRANSPPCRFSLLVGGGRRESPDPQPSIFVGGRVRRLHTGMGAWCLVGQVPCPVITLLRYVFYLSAAATCGGMGAWCGNGFACVNGA